MKKFVFVLFFISVLALRLYSQNNPFYSPFFQSGTTHWLFSPLQDTTSVNGNWSYLTPIPVPLFGVNAYYWADSSKIFVCGGADSMAIPHKECYFYNLNTNTYEPKAPLPIGRWSGKLVRVRDSLYLVGSIDSNYNSADGAIYRYSPSQNTWVQKTSMPSPRLMESAVCVWKDSLIISIGGSTNSFLGPTSYIRMYNVYTDTWRTLSTFYPVAMSTGHAEVSPGDSTIVVVGGIGNGIISKIFHGKIPPSPIDTSIAWDSLGITDTLWGNSIYRVAGARWKDYMIFGPAMKDSATSSKIFGISLGTDTIFAAFLPIAINNTGNVSTIAVKTGIGTDSSYFYIFGGYHYGHVLNDAISYAFTGPPPIGIEGNITSVPVKFKLYQNYPNPFNPATKIKFELPGGISRMTTLRIYDILGREVKVLINGVLKPGMYETEFDGTNMASGIYYYTITSQDFNDVKKMVLIK